MDFLKNAQLEMERKKILLLSLYVFFSQLSLTQEEPGVVIFGNFNYFHSQKKDFKDKYLKYTKHINDMPVKDSPSEEPPSITKPVENSPSSTPDLPPTVSPPTKPSLPPPVSGSGNDSGGSSGGGSGNDSGTSNGGGSDYLFSNKKWLPGHYQTANEDVNASGTLYSGMGSIRAGYTMVNNETLTVGVGGDNKYTHVGMICINGGTVYNSGNINVSGNSDTDNMGMVALEDKGLATNNGLITVNDQQIGMFGTTNTTLTNTGRIEVNSGKGMVSIGTGTAVNQQQIIVGSSSVGMLGYEGGTITNHSIISPTGKNSVGMAAISSANAVNAGAITVGKNQFGVYATEGSTASNTNTLTSNAGGISAYIDKNSKFENNGNIIVNSGGIGIYLTGGSTGTNNKYMSLMGGTGMKAGEDSSVINEAQIIANQNAVGLMAVKNGVVINNGQLQINGTSSVGLAAYENGKAINNETISLNDSGQVAMLGGGNATLIASKTSEIDVAYQTTGLSMYGDGSITNEGVMNISYAGHGIYVNGTGSAINQGEINIEGGNSIAMRSTGNNILTNGKDGIINIEDGQNGAYVFIMDGGKAQNKGKIYLGNSGILSSGGEVNNWGTITKNSLEEYFESEGYGVIIENGGEILKEDGTPYRLKEALIGLSHLPKLYEDSYETFSSPLALNNKADRYSSTSYLYEISSDEESIKARRKFFTELDETEIGRYLENVYLESTSTQFKDSLYHALRSVRNSYEFNVYLDKFFGRNFYPMVIFQTRDAINFTTDNILDNLENRYNQDKSNSYIVGYSLEKFKKKGFDRTTGYDEYLNGFYLGKQYTLNNISDYGFLFSYTRLEGDYNGSIGRRESNFFQGTGFMNYSKANVKGIALIYGGYSNGDIKRNLDALFHENDGSDLKYVRIDEKLHGDVKNFYIGASGKVSKRYDIKNIFFVEPEVKASVMGIFQRNLNESGGNYALELKHMDKVFSNIKIGTSVGKTFYPKDEYAFTIKLKGALAQDINSNNNNIDIKLKKVSDESTVLRIDNRNIFSKELGSRVELQKGTDTNFSFYVDYRYIFEEKNSWNLTGGFVYAF